MEYSFVIAIIPVILVVAFIAWIAKKITDGERLDMREGILGVVILMVAVLIMVPMVSSTQVYTWDDDTGELTIKKNVFGGYYAWDEYADEVRSLVIEDGVTSISAGAFDSLTGLEYLRIAGDAELTSSDFAVGLVDYAGQTITNPSAGQYVGTGDGELFLLDEGIYTYSSGGTQVTGLTEAAVSAVNLVLPSSHNGINIVNVSSGAFNTNTVIEVFLVLPDSHLTSIYSNAFNGCTSLTKLKLPDSLSSIGTSAFNGCTSLTDLALPSGSYNIGGSAFRNCTGLTSVSFPAGITSISSYAFSTVSAIESVTFASGFSANLDAAWAGSWTFYDSDGTTVLDKTVAANLAGYTFQGTAAALVKVAPGLLSLTTDQIQQVQLHTQELQTQDLDIQPLPFQPTVQTQDQEPVAA